MVLEHVLGQRRVGGVVDHAVKDRLVLVERLRHIPTGLCQQELFCLRSEGAALREQERSGSITSKATHMHGRESKRRNVVRRLVGCPCDGLVRTDLFHANHMAHLLVLVATVRPAVGSLSETSPQICSQVASTLDWSFEMGRVAQREDSPARRASKPKHVFFSKRGSFSLLARRKWL
jgi:hypothetical protein